LPVVLEKVSSLLRPRAPLIVNEFAWDQFDRETATWFWTRRASLTPRVRRRFGGRSPAACLNKWRGTFRDLHTYRQMRLSLDRRFTPRFFAWAPYLYEYPGGMTTEPHERRLIEAGTIRALGFRYIGRRRG
jgi:hypothetical protein